MDYDCLAMFFSLRPWHRDGLLIHYQQLDVNLIQHRPNGLCRGLDLDSSFPRVVSSQPHEPVDGTIENFMCRMKLIIQQNGLWMIIW